MLCGRDRSGTLLRKTYVLARKAGLFKAVADAGAHQVLITVGGGAVEVSVAGLNGPGDGGRAILLEVPGAEAKEGNSVEAEGVGRAREGKLVVVGGEREGGEGQEREELHLCGVEGWMR